MRTREPEPVTPSASDHVPGPEWWERASARRQAWLSARPGLSRALRLGTWAAVAVALVALALSPSLRLMARSIAPCWLLLVAWYLLARTKTLTWAAVARTFALGVPLAVVIAATCALLAAAVGLRLPDAGPSVGIAGAVEELLKLVPLAVVCLAAPGRARRFAVVDWLLLGLASGLAFQAFEDGLRRVAIAGDTSLLGMLLHGGDPYAEATSGVPQYGWSLLAGWSDAGGAFFAGHHVLTALVAAGIGIALRLGPGGRGAVRMGRWALPVGLWLLAVVAHAAYNAHAAAGARFVAGDTEFPTVLHLLWTLTARGRLLGPLLLVLAVVALVLDARRMRARDGNVPPHLGGWWPAWSDRFARRLHLRLAPPADAHASVAALVGVVRRLAVGFAFLAGAVVRDLAVVAVALSSDHPGQSGSEPATGAAASAAASDGATGESAEARVGGSSTVEPAPRRPPRPGRWAAAVALLRAHREDVHAVADRGSRRPFRAAAAIAWGAALVTGLAFAAWLATHLGVSLTSDAFWLAGLLERLADWWDSLGLGGQLAVTAGLAALIVLSGGSFGLALGLAGGATWVAEHGHGLGDFVRDPAGATRRFVDELTPQQAAALAAELFLQRLVPAGIGAGAGRAVRRSVDDLLDDPADFWRRRRAELGDDRGSVRLGPDRWNDPARRRALAEQWADRPTRPSRRPSVDNRPEGRPERIRSADDPERRRGIRRQNESAETLAEHGFRVEQAPDVPGPKNPDYRIEGEVFDCYSPSSANPRRIWRNVRQKVFDEQTDRVVLNLDDTPLTVEQVTDVFDAGLMPRLEEVIIVRNGIVIPFFP